MISIIQDSGNIVQNHSLDKRWVPTKLRIVRGSRVSPLGAGGSYFLANKPIVVLEGAFS